MEDENAKKGQVLRLGWNLFYKLTH
jgi:hypothetical protein